MKTKPKQLSRREFLSTSVAVTTFLALPSNVALGAGSTAPNNKLNIAGIGIGGQGGNDLNDVSSENIVALCDVDWDYAGHTFAKYPEAKRYKDFREMLDKEKSIDAVVIGTPDHTHAIVASAFMKAKKHVYLEKPMAKTIVECRKLADLAKETGVVTQM